jgi:ribose/xylose/arabinose/galactoside ABC-type transport system permease subunit
MKVLFLDGENSSGLGKIVIRVVTYRLFGVIVALLIMVVVLSVLTDKFFTYLNIMNILRQVSIAGIAAFGVTFTVLLGGLDISIGSVQGLVGILSSLILVNTNNPYLAFFGMIAIGLAVGMVNGFIITRLEIADIIVTIAMMFSLRGLTYLLTQAHSIQWTFKSWLNWLGTGHLGPVPAPVILLFGTFFLLHFVLKHTLFGRKVYAVGGDREAARVAGINVDGVRVQVYMLSGLLAAFAALILAARLSSGQPNAGIGFEFRVIAGVLLGGIALSGGDGDLFGTLIGVIFFGVLFNGLILMDVSSFWQQFLTGIIIIIAAWMDVRSRKRK